METIEIVGIILIFIGVILVILKAINKLPSKDKGEFGNKWFNVKGGPGLILVGFGVFLLIISVILPGTEVDPKLLGEDNLLSNIQKNEVKIPSYDTVAEAKNKYEEDTGIEVINGERITSRFGKTSYKIEMRREESSSKENQIGTAFVYLYRGVSDVDDYVVSMEGEKWSCAKSVVKSFLDGTIDENNFINSWKKISETGDFIIPVASGGEL